MRNIGWGISAIALLLSPPVLAAPSIMLSAPAAGTRYVAPATIEVTADPVVDPGRSIARVEFLADGALVGTVTQAPWSFTLTNVARGNLNLRARVVDSLGRRDTSEVVRVHVRTNTAPRIRVSAPEHRFIAPGSVPLTATVTDRDDPIAKVEFFSGDTLLATSTAEPYAFDWTGVPVGDYEVRAQATDTLGAVGISNLFRVRVRDNAAPRVRILGPANNSTFVAPATIPISLRAVDRDDNLTNAALFANGTQLATFDAAPFEFSWTNVPAGTYTLTAVATDDFGVTTTSRFVNVTVAGVPSPAEKKMYFIHVDHLNTPRMIADEQQRTVWRWDQVEPFGDNMPDENPSGLGVFEAPLRFPGQYFDRETGLHYNYFRDYAAETGRYTQSDPIGLLGGVNTFSYAHGSPLAYFDPDGLEVRFICRYLAGAAGLTFRQHCFVRVSCWHEGWSATLSLYGGNGVGSDIWPSISYKAASEGPDDPMDGVFNKPVSAPKSCGTSPCEYEKAIIRRFNSFQGGSVPYSPLGPNSNSFASGLITGNEYGGRLPPGAPGPTDAPGIGMQHPGFGPTHPRPPGLGGPR